MKHKLTCAVTVGILIGLLSNPCFSAEVTVGPTVPAHSEILFKGAIGPDPKSELKRLQFEFQIFHQRENVTLILDSPGGYVDDAFQQSTILAELDQARGKGEYGSMFNHVSSVIRLSQGDKAPPNIGGSFCY